MSLEECLEKIRSGPVPQNEESAKFQLIAPVLRSLGWNPDDGSEFLLEHSVGGKGGGRVDIALHSGDQSVALIEAKKPRVDLDSHVTQVLGYAFHEGVDICVLTTGLEWWLFLPREKGKPKKRRFAELDLLNDPVEQLVEDLSEFLHKEKLVSGEAVSKAKQVLKANREAEQFERRARRREKFALFGSKANLEAARLESEMSTIWRQMLSDPDDDLVELISTRVYEKLNLKPEKRRVIAVLGGKQLPTTGTSETPTTRPVAFTLWGVRYPISTQKAAYAGLVDRLYERHADDFDRVLELGGETPFVALDPSIYWGHHQVGSRYFLDTGTHTHTLVRRSGVFLECFGYDETDFEILFE